MAGPSSYFLFIQGSEVAAVPAPVAYRVVGHVDRISGDAEFLLQKFADLAGHLTVEFRAGCIFSLRSDRRTGIFSGIFFTYFTILLPVLSAVHEEVRGDQGKECSDSAVHAGSQYKCQDRKLEDYAEDNEYGCREKSEVQEHHLHECLNGLCAFARDGDIDECSDRRSEEGYGEDEQHPAEHDQRIRLEHNAGNKDRNDQIDGIDGYASKKREPDLLQRRFRNQDEELAAGVFLQRVTQGSVEHQERQSAGRDQERVDRKIASFSEPGGKSGRQGEYDHGDREDLPLREAETVVDGLVQEHIRSESSLKSVTLEFVASVLLADDGHTGLCILRVVDHDGLLLCLNECILVEVCRHFPDQYDDQDAGEEEQRQEQKRQWDVSFDGVAAEAAHPAPERNPVRVFAGEEIKCGGQCVFTCRYHVDTEDTGDHGVNRDDAFAKAGCAVLRSGHDGVESHLYQCAEDEYQCVRDEKGDGAPEAESHIRDKIRQLEYHIECDDQCSSQRSDEPEHEYRLWFHRAGEQHRHVSGLKDPAGALGVTDIRSKHQEEDGRNHEIHEIRLGLSTGGKESPFFIFLGADRHFGFIFLGLIFCHFDRIGVLLIFLV